MRAVIWWVLLFGGLAVVSALPFGALGQAGPALPWAIYLQLLFATGFLSLLLMSVAMILALRLPWIEDRVGGLDQAYRLHRQTGQWGVGLGLAHYLIKLGSKELRKDGLLVKPKGFDSGIPELFDPLHDVAKLAGEWGLYAALALIAIALIRAIPYRVFVRWHRILPVLYLGFVLHGLVFMPLSYWTSPASGVIVILSLAGLAAAGLSLSGQIGRRRQVQGRIAQVTPLGNRVLEVLIDLGPGWPGHRAGQFALVTFDTAEGAHPFTLASAWGGDGRVRLAIKALGDYTATLPDTLCEGDPVRLEGPYGRFVFNEGIGRQIWIAGGIGVTPFVARLEHRAAMTESAEPVDLFYSTQGVSADVLARLRGMAEAGAVRLHVIDTGHDGLLDAPEIMDKVPDWANASLWFCGPAGFGDALERGFTDAGLPRDRFHREAFDFR